MPVLFYCQFHVTLKRVRPIPLFEQFLLTVHSSLWMKEKYAIIHWNQFFCEFHSIFASFVITIENCQYLFDSFLIAQSNCSFRIGISRSCFILSAWHAQFLTQICLHLNINITNEFVVVWQPFVCCFFFSSLLSMFSQIGANAQIRCRNLIWLNE